MRRHQRPERLAVTGPGGGQRRLDAEVGGGFSTSFKAMRRTHRHTVTPGYDKTDEFSPESGSDTEEGVAQAPRHGDSRKRYG